MTYKQIKKTQLENKKLYEDKIISKQEYIDKQFELLRELRAQIHKMEQFDLEIFKTIKNWFKKKLIKKTN